jgi:hypothetical protein
MEALAVAEKWFRHMDKGLYLKVYRDSSTVLKEHLTEKNWKRSFQYKFLTFGKKLKRSKTRDALLYNLRPFPEGAYTEIDYQTQYSKRGITRERLILRWEEGKWRVCGYTLF